MTSTPAVWFRIAGVLFGVACTVQDDGGTLGTQSEPNAQSTSNPAVLADCTTYCNHVYANATGCDMDVLETESAGCHAFCSLQSTTIDEGCAETVGAAYSCIVEQSIAYACSDEDASPEPIEDTCRTAWDAADMCMGNQ